MLITDVAVKNRTSVLLLCVMVLIIGAYSYHVLPREAAPDVPVPYILITTVHEGVAPEDIESSVTLKIEKELAGIKGIKELTSSSAEGVSVVLIEFMPDVVIEDALQRVRDRVDLAKGDLPRDAEEPVIAEINISEFPIMTVSLSGGVSPVQLEAICDELEDTLEAIPGVLGVDVSGLPEREIRLELDPDRLASYHLTVPEILALIPSENVNISAGGLETEGAKFNVRVPAEFVGPEEVDKLLLTIRDGHPIYLSDVATVRDTFKDRASFARLDGEDGVTLSIRKRIGANIISISDRVKDVMAGARTRLPEGVKVEIIYDVSKYIRDMVADLENNMASGLVLVIGCLVLFLGLRSSGIVSMIIPLSMLASFAVLRALGYTLNMIVLFSLILAVGMLVDSAIVIVENIYRHLQLGKPRLQAAIIGTREVAWPVTTSTLTNIASFLPLAFWPGIMGSFMKYLPITVMIVLTCSLLVALVVNPTLCAMFASAERARPVRDHWFVRGYRRAQKIGLDHPLTTLGTALCLLVALGIAYAKYGRGVQFFPDADPDRAMINIRCPQGTNIREVDRLVRLVEQRLEPFRPDIEHIVSSVGASEGGEGLFGDSGPHLGNLTVVFYDLEVRKRPSAQVIADMRRAVEDIAGAEVKVEKEENGPPTGAAVTVRIIGRDFDALETLSDQARQTISDVPGLVNLRSDLEATRPELVFTVDRRKAVMLGVNTAIVGNFLKTAIFGSNVGTWRQFNDEYDITVRLPLAQRVNIEDLMRLRIPNAAGQSVALSSLGTFDYRGGLGTIKRINQKRVVTITGDAEGRYGTEVLKDAQARLAALDLPEGYEISYAGEKEEQDKAAAFLMRSFAVAVMIILLILVIEFNTLWVPLIIMMTVVLALIGVLVGLLVCSLPFGIIMTGIAVISLAGIIVNNGIVLLDYTRQLQEGGMDVVSATVEAGVTRLRPVLLSAATNFVGLIPMAVGISYDFHTFSWATRSASSEWWNNMSISMIFGLMFGTVLTLVVIPSLYVMLFRVMDRFGWGGLRRAGAKPGLDAVSSSRPLDHRSSQ